MPLRPFLNTFLGSVLVLLALFPHHTIAQCSFPLGFPTSYCINDAAIPLTGGTNYYGPGVSGTTFTPSSAGVGTHRIFTTTGATTSYTASTSGIFSPYLLGSPTQIFPGSNSFQDVPIGFNFSFYGSSFTTARIFDNAFIRFTTDTDGSPAAQLIPNAATPNNLIAAAWGDLDPATGIIQYQTIGTAPLRVLVIDYINVRFVTAPSQFVTTQIQLYETSNIVEIHSTQIGTDVTDLKTMGVENSDGSMATAVAGRNRSSWTANNDFVAFIPICTDRRFVTVSGLPDDTLPVSPSATTICENGTVNVSVGSSQIGTSYQLRNSLTDAILSSTVLGNGGIITLTSSSIPADVEIVVKAVNLTTLCYVELLNDVDVTVNLIPTTAVAGANQNICGLSTTLIGNIPTIGIGTWSKVSGPGTVLFTLAGANSPGATATVSQYGTYVLRWTITNGACPSNFSNTTVNFFETPSTSFAGADLFQCNNGTFTMAANSPAIGTGTWSVVSGVAIPASPSLPTSSILGVPAGTSATLRWTITNGVCSSNSSDVVLTNNAAPTPVIFGSNSVCPIQAGLVYATPGSGNTYSWSIVGGTITSSNTTNSITVTWGGTGTGSLQLSETNPALCNVTTAPYLVTINPAPTSSFTGPSVACANESGLTYSTVSTSGYTYSWNVNGGTITAGAGTPGIIVDWGATAFGTVQLTTTISATGCSTPSTPLIVTLNPLPTPVITGPNSVCPSQGGVNYTTPGSGNMYTWSILGGTITLGAGTNSIVVDWDAGGAASLLLTEKNTTTNCSFTTSLFPVTINSNPTPSIVGNASVCEDQAGVTYTTSTASGRSYGWTVIGGIITSGIGTNSITVTWGLAGPGSVQLTETITATGCSVMTAPFLVTINPGPVPIISGVNEVCTNQSGVAYSTPATGNSYSWTIIGGTITSGVSSNSILVDWNATGPASLQVTEISSVAPFCAITTAQFSVTINPAPNILISGTVNSCANKTGVVYTTPSAANLSYSWSISGGTITSGASTPTITVTWGAAGTGRVRITKTNTLTLCAATSPDYFVTIAPLPTPAISGPSSSCAFQSGLVYTTTNNAGNTYLWTVSAGGTIIGPNNTNSVTINWGAAGARTVRVTETNSLTGCLFQTPNYNVTVANPNPVISGAVNVCSNQASVSYSTPTAGGRTYVWSVTNGSIISGGTTASIIINWGATGPGQIQLTETITATGCFVTTTVYSVNINPVPAPNITGAMNVCGNQSNVIYTTPSVTGHTYAWSVSGGGIFSGAGTNSISVGFGPSGMGVVSLVETITATGCATATALNVAIASPSPVISGLSTVCPNQTNVNYSTPAVTGNTYNWIIVGGTMISGGGTNSINVNWGSTSSGAIFLTETITANGCATATSPFFVTILTGPTAYAGSDAASCEGTPYNFAMQTLPANAANYASILWTTTGSGLLTMANTLTPIYTPGSGESGARIFTLTALSLGGCLPVMDEMILTITPLPIVQGGSDLETCQGTTVDFSTQVTAATASNYATLQWTTTGSGTLFNATSLSPIYIPSAGETGLKIFTLSATGNGSCTGASDVVNLIITPIPVVTAGSDDEICQGTAFDFGTQTSPAAASNFSSLSWATTGSGTFVNTNSLTPVYTAPPGESGPVDFILNVIGNGSCGTVQDQLILTVTPSPSADAGSAEQICQGSLFSFASLSTLPSALNYSSVNWTHLGSGTLLNSNTLTPVYQPAAGETGTIPFTMTAVGIGSCGNSMDIMPLTIHPAPVVSAGSDAETCEGVTINFTTQFSPANAFNFSSLLWTTTGLGVLTGSTSLSPSYTPDPGESGAVTFNLKANGIGGICPFVEDFMVLSITPAVSVDAGSDEQACQSPSFGFSVQTLPATTSNASALQWTHSGTGTLFNATTSVPTYLLGLGETGNVVFTLTAQSTGTCPTLNDAMTVNFVPAPFADAGSNAQLCEGEIALDFSGRTQPAIIANGLLTWSHNGTGTLANPTSLDPTYTVGAGDVGSTITFISTVADVGSVCTPDTDQMTLKINPLPVVVFSGLPPVISEKNIPIQLTGNKSGGLFTIFPLTSNIGSTVSSPTDNVFFDPDAAELGVNTITYKYTDPNGCMAQDSKAVVVNPVTIIDFTLQYQNPPFGFAASDGMGGFEICAEVGAVRIVGSPAASTGILPTNFVAIGANAGNITIYSSLGEYYIDTQNLPSDTYEIQYNYTNAIGTPSPPLVKKVKVFASPSPVITVLDNCIISAIDFNGSYGLPATAYPPASIAWSWAFGAGEGLSDEQNPSHIYGSAGNKNVTLEVTTSQGCTGVQNQSITVGDRPIVDFEWASICTNDTTRYADRTDPGTFSNITAYSWDFGDGDFISGTASGTIPDNTHGGRTLGSFMNPKHKYTSSGVFTTKLVVDTNTGCSNSIMYDVFILPSGSTTDLSPINPYAVDFTMSTGGWIPEGLKISGPPNPLVISPISWRVDSLVNSTITSPTGMAWWTGKNKGTFFPSEQSALNGPCFNFSQLTRPMVALDYWSDGENNLDGAVLQYSTDGGLQWIVVGPPEGQVDRDEGINWYNGLGIPSNPGKQNTGNYGWTGKSTEWKNARFDLDMIPDSLRDQVRLRVAFSSNNVNIPGVTFQGFALRSFFVGDKKRNVLVEHFTNLSSPESIAGDNYIDSLFQDQIDFRGKSDFHDIQYHVSFPNADSLNMDNPNDPAARALFYGVSQPPATIMDGILDGLRFKGNYNDLSRVEINRRALMDPLFDLQLVEESTSFDNLISVTLTITALADLNTPLIANVALVENQIGTFKNVLRKQLFQSDGETIKLSFNKGDILIKASTDVKIDVPITNPNQLRLVGYIQNKNTKQIYQSVVIPASHKEGIVVVGLAETTSNAISVYPNPAKGSFYLGLPSERSTDGFSWKLVDQRGVIIRSGDMAGAINGIKQIDVSLLAGGIYIVKVEGPIRFSTFKKLVVINGN